jgi:hypothetical protein
MIEIHANRTMQKNLGSFFGRMYQDQRQNDLHADQARRQIRQPNSDLAARPSLVHDDRTALIQAHDVK